MLSRMERRHQRFDFWPVAAGNVGNLLSNLGFAIFGGTAPLVATWLIRATGDLAAPPGTSSPSHWSQPA
jgi:hypothetical protein